MLSLLKTKIMENPNPDNVAYLNFIEDLNEILIDVEINKLNYS